MCEKDSCLNKKELGNIQGKEAEYICGPYCNRRSYCMNGLAMKLIDGGGEFITPCGAKVKVLVERSVANE